MNKRAKIPKKTLDENSDEQGLTLLKIIKLQYLKQSVSGIRICQLNGVGIDPVRN